ncbi:P68 family surface lipoprotein [Mesomycoplasma conjunctivae]|uniref:P68 family surface lipoprotein n=1 Tax=Mesomycoplasma conjunctivae TaxID=45361 RepID=UPI003DA38304
MTKKISKLTKKTLFTTFSLVPLLTLASCQVTTRFDQVEDNVIKLGHIFTPSKTDSRFSALEKIMHKWNNLDDVKNGTTSKLELSYFSGNYESMIRNLSVLLETKDKQKSINLALNYPSLAALLNRYDMLLNFADNQDLKTTINETFVGEFLVENKNIVGLDDKGIWTIPVTKASKTLIINKPLLSYIVTSALEATDSKSTIKAEDKEFFENLDKAKTDVDFIKKVWGNYQKLPLDQGGLDGYEFSKEKLENYKDLFDLSIRIKKSFPDANKKDKQANLRAQWPIGFNDGVSVWFASNFAEANGNYNDFIFHNSEKDGNIFEYTLDQSPDSKGYQIAKKTYEQFNELQQNDAAAYFGPVTRDTAQATDWLVRHQMVFAITSTTSYRRKFLPEGQYFFNIYEQEKSFSLPISSTTQLWNISKSTDTKDENVIAQISQVISNAKSFVIVGVKPTKNDKNPDNNIYLDPEKDASIIENVKKVLNDNQDGGFLTSDRTLISLGSEGFDKTDFYQKLYKNEDESKKDTNKNTKSKQSKYVFIKKTGNINVKNIGGEETLNKNEVLFLQEPVKNEVSNTKKIITYQGPSLIGMHANKQENESSYKFVKWFISSQESFEYEDSKEKKHIFNGTPNEFLAFQSNYLVPSKSTFSSDIKDATKFPQNPLFELIYNNFKTVSQNPNEYALFSEPTSQDSSFFRSAVRNSLAQIDSLIRQNESENKATKKVNFEEFIKGIKKNIINK